MDEHFYGTDVFGISIMVCDPNMVNSKKNIGIEGDELILQNHLNKIRTDKNLSQRELAELVGVSRNTISSIERGEFNPTAKLALILCIALDKKFEELFYFD